MSLQSQIAKRKSQVFLALAAMALALPLAGCQTAHVANPVTAEASGNDPDAQLTFWHTLAERHVTSNDEAFHGLLLYVEGTDPANDYAGRVDALKQRRMLASGFAGTANQAVTRGTLAVAILRALEIKGGLILTVFGPTERYATRELMFREIYPTSSPQQTFSGGEFLGIMGRVEDYQRGNPAKVSATVLPGEMERGSGKGPAGTPASMDAAPPATQPSEK